MEIVITDQCTSAQDSGDDLEGRFTSGVLSGGGGIGQVHIGPAWNGPKWVVGQFFLAPQVR